MQPPNGCSARRKKIIIIKNSSHGISFIVRASGLPGVCAPLSTSAQRKKEKKTRPYFGLSSYRFLTKTFFSTLSTHKLIHVLTSQQQLKFPSVKDVNMKILHCQHDYDRKYQTESPSQRLFPYSAPNQAGKSASTGHLIVMAWGIPASPPYAPRHRPSTDSTSSLLAKRSKLHLPCYSKKSRYYKI